MSARFLYLLIPALFEIVLRKFAFLIRSMFGSTYFGEQLFSFMQRNKSVEISHTRLSTVLKRHQPGKSENSI